MASGNSWKRRWAMIRLVTFATCAMGLGLFLIPPELAKEISSSVALIVASLCGLVGVYMGAATWDDKE